MKEIDVAEPGFSLPQDQKTGRGGDRRFSADRGRRPDCRGGIGREGFLHPAAYLDALRRRAPVHYELVAVNVDAGFPGYRKDLLAAHLAEHGFPCHLETTDCYRIIEEKRRPGSSYCAFCARLRRGCSTLWLTNSAATSSPSAITSMTSSRRLLLNQFYVGTLKAMSPKLLADNGRHTVIRPLVYVPKQTSACSPAQRLPDHQLCVPSCRPG